MSLFPLKPAHKPVKAYYEALARFEKHGHITEGNTRSAFSDLLKRCCSAYGWHLVEEYQFKGTGKQPLRADGALVDELTLVHGFWEAKDTADDLEGEVRKKRAAGYPLTNILFQSPTRAILYQDQHIAFNEPITEAEKLVEVLERFFEHRQQHETDWEEAVYKFGEKIPDLAGAVTKILEDEDTRNPRFREAFAAFVELCRESINPDLAEDAVRKMLVQHILTVRIFTRVFQNEDFVRKNVIAAEIERVIDTITVRYFSRSEFLKPLDRFYTAIEKAAESQTGYTEKQHFLNAVYEKFFQRFDRKQADTLGIVYTPQPIVDFMVRSVEEILQREFGKSLSDSGVHILDPFTGTGNFITRIIQQIKRSALPQKYAEELHCNEIMLLPYYIASMNIEHAYHERSGQYAPFEGICLVDTFELGDAPQHSLFTAANTARVERQRANQIFVVIANPPYHMQRENEEDDTKVRSYPEIDRRVSQTYVSASKAQLRSKLSDPYVKAFRWASDRIGEQGVVCFVSNNGFIDQKAFDGMRQHLLADFNKVFHFDLKGNARTAGERRRREAGNVFDDQIRVGVGITLLVRTGAAGSLGDLRVYRTDDYMRSAEKKALLTKLATFSGTPLVQVTADSANNWLTEGEQEDFSQLLRLGAKQKTSERDMPVFERFSLGVNTARDTTAYGESLVQVTVQVEMFARNYDDQLTLAVKARKAGEKVSFSNLDLSRNLKVHLRRADAFSLMAGSILPAAYRPFRKRFILLQDILIDELGVGWRDFAAANDNTAICWNIRSLGPQYCLATAVVPDYHFTADTVCYCFYKYQEDGTRSENITDWARDKFCSHYGDPEISKWNIFHATYAILHHPEYLNRYAANLKRELPRIPFPLDFHAFAQAGKRLMELHINYEEQPEYKLEHVESEIAEVSWRVERMRVNPKTVPSCATTTS